MSIGLLGRKLGMTQVYDGDGNLVPVTVVGAEPNVVVRVQACGEGKKSVQMGFETVREKRLTKPLRGHFAKAGIAPRRFLREFVVDATEEWGPGQEVGVNLFRPGQLVDVIGISKGKGFQGVMKKHNFSGQGAAHGSKMHRRNGAVGCRSTPGRIYRNQGMPGQLGSARTTVQDLAVVSVREEDRALLIRGSIPGARGGLVVVRTAIKGQPKPPAKPQAKAAKSQAAGKSSKK
ncbi:50S ribosomal protein L3 [Methylacidimicrobium cyclopophantes]|uniref:Large ribosomal subunit protein uL3 n=1 Tax=Methylacidimicrobium cyclopophantes TaxID=1041766 RepID=A0A5E6MII2_9BACT|nr:50S ribosomal protein L3 [Methylacidimicrobium cyclopophantes]VVM05866.1 50S ribosomal protein L3 [Methylacidimicrobium cyclopophantes]